jgi:hypothetical protein
MAQALHNSILLIIQPQGADDQHRASWRAVHPATSPQSELRAAQSGCQVIQVRGMIRHSGRTDRNRLH